MISDWLANQECFFSGEFSIKTPFQRVQRERKFEDHIEDRRIKKEVSPNAKASTAKATL